MSELAYTLEIDGSPAPAALLAAVQRIEVEDHAELADMLRLRLAVGVQESGSAWTVLDEDVFTRLARVTVKLNAGTGRSETLIDAYVVDTQVNFANQPGQSVLDVVAMDPTVLMNLDEKVKAWPNMSDSDIASAIFGDAAYGFRTVVDTTEWRREEQSHTVLQRGTDIRFLKELAARNGFECFVETNPETGETEGHFHAPRLDEQPQGVLTVNMGEATNVNAFHARFDMLKPVTAQVSGLDVESRETQPAEARNSTRPGLGASGTVASDRPRRVLLARTGMAQAGELQAYAQAVVDGSAMAIHAEGELNTVAYGLLHAKHPVTVRGVGRQFSGVYYVEKVLHVLDANGHAQRFTLRRNALGLTGQERFDDDRAVALRASRAIRAKAAAAPTATTASTEVW